MSEPWSAPREAPSTTPEAGSITMLTRIVVVVFAVQVVSHLVCTVGVPLLELAYPAAYDEPSTAIEILVALGTGLAGLVLLVTLALSIPLWMYWHFRAAKNLVALGRQVEYTPAAHVYWWFVPFANLVLPFRSMQELYRGSDTEAESWHRAPIPASFPLWWGSWLLGNVLSNTGQVLLTAGATSAIPAIGLLVSSASTCLYLLYISRIAARQDVLLRRAGW